MIDLTTKTSVRGAEGEEVGLNLLNLDLGEEGCRMDRIIDDDIESAFDAADRQAATTCLRLTHDDVFGSAREALREGRAKQGSRW